MSFWSRFSGGKPKNEQKRLDYLSEGLALERQGDNVEGLVLMADLATERGAAAADEAEQTRQWDLARDFLRRALEADPTDHRVYSAQALFRRYAPD